MATSVVKVDNKKYEASQTALSAAVADIVVKDAATCLEAKKIQKNIRDEMKQRHFILDPFVVQAKANYDDARDERAKWIDPLEKLDETLADKVKTFEREEREAAKREEDRINAENARLAREKAEREQKEREKAAKEQREAKIKEINAALKAGDIGKREAAKMLKEAGADAEAAIQQAAADAEIAKNAPPPKVEVKPNIPTVSGVPSRRNWKFRFAPNGENILLDAFREKMELRTFVQPNEQEIGRMVRDTKDKKLAESRCPGIEVYED
jgi:hypothetical protein